MGIEIESLPERVQADVQPTDLLIVQPVGGTTSKGGLLAMIQGALQSITGILKISGGTISAATGADLPAMTATVGGAVPTPPNDATRFLNGQGAFTVPPSGSGTVTTVSVVSANGFAGSVATAGTTPAITMSVTFTGLAKANGTSLSAAVAGTDYLVPPAGSAMLKANAGGALANATAGTDYSAGTAALATGILKSTTTTGALSIAVAETDYVTPTGAGTLSNKTLTAPTINGGTATALTGLAVRNAGTGAFDMTIAHNGNLTAGRALTWNLNDAARTISLAGNITTAGAFTLSGAFASTFTFTNTTTVTFPVTGTLATLAGAESLSNKTLPSPSITGALGAALNWGATVTIASAGTVNIGAAASNDLIVSGTTTITAFDTIAAGAMRKVKFTGVLTLTHNATSLILPGGASITTANGDVAQFTSLGSGNWKCDYYTKADGTAVVSTAGSVGNHCVTLHTGNGFGSTNTGVRRFTTVLVNTGTALTLTQSAGNGDSVAVVDTGLYAMTYQDLSPASTNFFGVTVNGSDLTSSPSACTVATRAVMAWLSSSSRPGAVTRVMRLTAGDVVRCQAGSDVTGTSDQTYFSICKVGS